MFTMQKQSEKLTDIKICKATNEEIIAYLSYSHKLAEIATLAEQDAMILSVCEQLEITATDEELQEAGDAFRKENKLIGVSETLDWIKQQRITVEDWSQGIKVSLLTQKLKEYLFGESVDIHYIGRRDDYKRVALSQILVRDLTEAMKIAQMLKEERFSFCALAIQYSKGQQSKENGGFVGIRFLTELIPEIAQAIADSKEGDIIGPIQTKLGYHVLRVEKYFPTELSEVREQVLKSLFQSWLQVGK